MGEHHHQRTAALFLQQQADGAFQITRLQRRLDVVYTLHQPPQLRHAFVRRHPARLFMGKSEQAHGIAVF